MKTEIKQIVSSYVINATFADKQKIKDETLIFQEGFFDSMGFVMLLGFLDDTFGIKPSDEELIETNFESINAITNFILNKKAA
jgi:acyl carrier protein